VAYLLDANIFIRAKKLHYGFDFCPAFWDWLIDQNNAGRVFSIERVHDEIRAGADELSDWADARGAGFFLQPDDATIPALATVSTWANGQAYTPAAVSTFLQVADYYLVTQALAGEHVVVTHEKADAAINRITIPNACIALKVKCMTPFEMLRVERARFVLGAAK
jgi:hypothetical protein